MYTHLNIRVFIKACKRTLQNKQLYFINSLRPERFAMPNNKLKIDELSTLSKWCATFLLFDFIFPFFWTNAIRKSNMARPSVFASWFDVFVKR